MHTQPLSLVLPPPNGFDDRAMAAFCAAAGLYALLGRGLAL